LGDPKLVETANRVFTEAKIRGVLYVLNRVRDEEMESHMRRRLEEKQVEPIGIIHEDDSIAMAWLEGTPLDGTTAKKDADSIIKELEAAEEAPSAT
jgi:CO dehydrogenase nickel-insertion accessory protein CooC1